MRAGRDLLSLTLIAAAAVLLFGGAAQAAPITIGSPLSGTFKSGTLPAATLFNLSLPEAGAQATSPVDGAIVRWRVLDAAGPLRLRVLRPLGGKSYQSVGASTTVNPASLGTEAFATNLPVRAGDTIGIDSATGSKLGYQLGGPIAGWVPPLGEGESSEYVATEPVELAFNADVQPRPTVTALTPSSDSIRGGSTVTVAGTDFAGVSGVSFGSVPATAFSVGSEGSLTAVVPASAGPGTVDVTVTTVAGTSPVSAADRFTYVACAVPKLKGLKLKAARKKLRQALCRPGKVRLRGGATAKTGRVVKQSPKPRTTLAPEAKVNLTLR
ncbi:MAG TPA: IPT/TIG domain-containing protein [Solirubrobacterales bacterium]